MKFSKIASDYALFFSHAHGGPSDNAKYVLRVWKDIGLNAIQDLTDEEIRMLALQELPATIRPVLPRSFPKQA